MNTIRNFSAAVFFALIAAGVFPMGSALDADARTPRDILSCDADGPYWWLCYAPIVCDDSLTEEECMAHWCEDFEYNQLPGHNDFRDTCDDYCSGSWDHDGSSCEAAGTWVYVGNGMFNDEAVACHCLEKTQQPH